MLYDTLIDRGATATGFLVSEFEGLRSQFAADMSRWIAEGRVHYREDVLDGLESCPEALRRVLSGRNFGKVLVRSNSRSPRPWLSASRCPHAVSDNLGADRKRRLFRIALRIGKLTRNDVTQPTS